ncbi:MAG: alpha/beta fold hydrolase [Bacteroidota bacterium]
MIWILGFFVPLLFFLILYLLGPKPEKPQFDLSLPELSPHLFEIEESIQQKEALIPNIREDNEARIVWSHVQAEKTEYAIVYLHGFSASQGDAKPVHMQFAEHFAANLYLPRLQAHGLNSKESLLEFDPEAYMRSAVEAYAVGRKLGKKLILMGTSTGASLALYLAAHFPDIHGLILISPNIELFDKKTLLLNRPWGLQIARAILKSKYRKSEVKKEEQSPYWDHDYRLEAAVQVKNLVDHSMYTEIFDKVKQPAFVAYYYKNEQEQDQTVSVSAIKRMFEQLGTAQEKKRLENFPEAGDHCIGSDIWSGAWEELRDRCILFAKEVLDMQPEI